MRRHSALPTSPVAILLSSKCETGAAFKITEAASELRLDKITDEELAAVAFPPHQGTRTEQFVIYRTFDQKRSVTLLRSSPRKRGPSWQACRLDARVRGHERRKWFDLTGICSESGWGNALAPHRGPILP